MGKESKIKLARRVWVANGITKELSGNRDNFIPKHKLRSMTVVAHRKFRKLQPKWAGKESK